MKSSASAVCCLDTVCFFKRLQLIFVSISFLVWFYLYMYSFLCMIRLIFSMSNLIPNYFYFLFILHLFSSCSFYSAFKSCYPKLPSFSALFSKMFLNNQSFLYEPASSFYLSLVPLHSFFPNYSLKLPLQWAKIAIISNFWLVVWVKSISCDTLTKCMPKLVNVLQNYFS